MSRPLLERLARAWGELTGAPPRARRDTYKGAEMSRLTADWFARAQRADEEIKRSLRRLRGRARDLARNSSTVRYFRMLVATNVIGARGMRLQARVRASGTELDAAVNRTIEEAWADWSRARVSVDGRHTLASLEQLAVKTLVTDGEVFVRLLRNFPNEFGFALQLIDADQVDEHLNRTRGREGNEIRLGVEVDQLGAAVAYHVYDERRGLPSVAANRTRVPAEDMLHLYLPERAYQTRGVTWLQSAMFPIKMKEGYTEAELVAARTSAAKMGFFQRRQDALVGEMGAGDGTPESQEAMEANAGTFEVIEDGYEVVPFDPQHPTTAFAPFLKSIMRDVASGFGVSYNALANDLEGVNFSSMRSGLLMERDLWKIIQEWWVTAFSIPVYREWLNLALLKGALALPSRDYRNYTRVRFIPRGWAWVDPLKDVQASALGIASGLTSRQQVLAEQGLDFDEIVEQLAEEKATAEAMGVSIDPPGKSVEAAMTAKTDDEDEKGSSKDESKNGDDRAGRYRLAGLVRN